MLGQIRARAEKWWYAESTWSWCMIENDMTLQNGEAVIGILLAVAGALSLIVLANIAGIVFAPID